MQAIVEVTALYDGDPDEIFQNALRFEELTEAMEGFAVYEGLPDEPAREGETYTVDVTFWGILKMRGHTMYIEKLDIPGRLLQSRESGNGIERWDHTLTVESEDGRARWRDRILIDAGWRTPIVTRFARHVYTYRHRHRAALEVRRSIGPGA